MNFRNPPKKGHKHNEFGQKPPLPDPPQETPDPANSLCLGPLFPLKYRKKAYIKKFERGGSWGPKVLHAEFLRVLLLRLRIEKVANKGAVETGVKRGLKKAHKP